MAVTQMFDAPVGQIKETPDLRDPMGDPKIVTGPEYMHALAEMGYNIDTMSSSLPLINKIASSATNFMDEQIKQHQAYDQGQADLAYKTAQARNEAADADYNEQALGYRIRSLDYDNQKKANDLAYQSRTLEGAIAAENAKDAMAPTLDQQAKQEGDQRIALNKQSLQDNQNKLNLEKKAQDEWAELKGKAPAIDDPDYDAKWADLIGQYSNAVGNPATRDQVKAFKEGRDLARSTNVTFQQRLSDQAALKAAIANKSLDPGTDVDTLSRNHAASVAAVRQSNISGTLDRVQTLLYGLPKTVPPELTDQVRDLVTFRDTLKGILANPEQGMTDVRNGFHAGTFNTDGSLGPQLEGDLRALEDYRETYFKRAGEYKPPEFETTVRPPKPGELGTGPDQTGPITETKVKTYGQPYTGTGQAGTTAAPPSTPVAIKAWATAHPEYKPLVDKWMKSGKAEDLNEIKRVMGFTTAAAAPPGFQAGGPVDQVAATQSTQDMIAASMLAGQNLANQPPSASYQTGGDVANAPFTLGSTDTVPAMLTPGEFVINKPAADAIGQPALNRMNQTGQVPYQAIATTPDLRDPMQPLPALFPREGTTQSRGQPEQSSSQQPLKGSPLSPIPPVAAATTPPTTPPATTGTTTQPTPTSTGSTTGTTTTTAGGGWKSTVGSEFGEVDNPKYGGYTEAGWDTGKWGDKISGWDTEGVALPGVPRGTVVEIRNPKTGATTTTTVKDSGPAPRTGAGIDLLAGTRTALGFGRNFKGPVQFRIVSGPQQQQTAGMNRGGFVPPVARFNRGGAVVYGYSPAARALGGNAPSIAADLSSLPEGNPLYSPSVGAQARQPVSAPGYQHGGFVSGGELGGGRGGGRGAGGGGDEGIFGGGQAGGAGGDGWMPQQRARHKRFHPRLPGQQGPDIPDEMQKKLAKLGHDYLSGLSGLIQSRPEFGPQLLRHARNQLASNMGAGDEEEGQPQMPGGIPGGGGEDQGQQYSPAQYAMTAQMGQDEET